MVDRRAYALDATMALVLTVVAQVELAALHRDPAGETVGAYSFDVALALVTTLPLAFRRWFPAAVPTAVFAVHVLANVMFAHAQSFFSFTTALAVLSYTIGRHAAPRAAGVGWILGAAWVATFWIHTPGFRDPGSFAFGAAVMVLPWAAGWTISELHTQRASLDRALSALAAAEERRRDSALLEERTRIAREMHDVLAHGVSVMVVQAGAARLALPADADEAREGLLSIESTGRGVLRELRRTVGLLRDHDENTSVLPAPGLADLPALARAMRDAGLDVELDVSGPRPADSGRELAAYRVVQEALTNCLRHAGPTRVRVTVTGGPELEVRVEDQGRRGKLPATGPGGNGLLGLRERVGVYGRSLEAGPARDGFVVDARIPTEEVG